MSGQDEAGFEAKFGTNLLADLAASPGVSLMAGAYINGALFMPDASPDTPADNVIVNPYNNEVIARIRFGGLAELERAIASAHGAFHAAMKRLPAHERASLLRKAADLLEDELKQFARVIMLEAGKPIRDSRAEVRRSVQILRLAEAEALKLDGQLVPMDAAAGGEGRIGMVRLSPLGVVAAIAPFNFPLNLVLHKVAPAIAAGNTVVLKPSEKTPLSSLLLARLLTRAGLPDGALNVVAGEGSLLGEALVSDPRISKITFTGSVPVGQRIQRLAGFRKLTLELGSNSPNIVFDDADLEQTAAGLVRGAFIFAGQVCISVQRIYVQSGIYNEFQQLFVSRTKALKLGNPADENTDIGPMISEEEAVRTERWIREAEALGAVVLTGGTREGALFSPTVMTRVKPDMKIMCRETFAPVVSLIPFDTEEEVLRMANASDFGIQAGVFTTNINRALRVADGLETGGVWINEISTYRQDNYPYGGIKQSGVGREGVGYAVRDMCESKFIGIKY
ncbi:Acyl-CoA reductase [Paenibacillus sp. UNCCL117]|uniref:aldehyde dehydrogenase family protein n=1 Tax=unclassified Paenibacillus TaxID=185978 RepID=UPI00088C1440|nr:MULTISPECIES: aldehyde dehydrogenase family protein [unclassified Paenibacillus]SDE03130.1 Acyl-CoA reductase [Paenibacillus sp. cl123]SFW57348.1 Acyl-CoA reductase [Paenibacillus sp. UNCCL117]